VPHGREVSCNGVVGIGPLVLQSVVAVSLDYAPL